MKIDASLIFAPVEIARMAGELEKIGFDSVYTFEGQSDPFIGATVATLNTQHIDIMTSIAVSFARNPMGVAYLANDLQQLSNGRFILGLGTQVKAHVEKRYSMPWSHPVSRQREFVMAVKAIWNCWKNGTPLNFKGKFYQHTLMSPVFTPAKSDLSNPKIFLAGVGPKMTEVAGEVADGYFVHPFHTPLSYAELSMPALRRGLDKAGKTRSSIQISAQLVTATGLDDESLKRSIASARSQIAFYASTPAYLPVLEVHGWEGLHRELNALSRKGKWAEMSAKVDDDILNTFAVVGTPEQVAEKLVERGYSAFDRISPVLYAPDLELLSVLLASIKSAIAKV